MLGRCHYNYYMCPSVSYKCHVCILGSVLLLLYLYVLYSFLGCSRIVVGQCPVYRPIIAVIISSYVLICIIKPIQLYNFLSYMTRIFIYFAGYYNCHYLWDCCQCPGQCSDNWETPETTTRSWRRLAPL